jgi:hypothetical protein
MAAAVLWVGSCCPQTLLSRRARNWRSVPLGAAPPLSMAGGLGENQGELWPRDTPVYADTSGHVDNGKNEPQPL